jgi:pimeloyl-ACP methyl ester carboxylesterase
MRLLTVVLAMLLLLASGAQAAMAPSVTKARVQTLHAGQGTIGYRAVGRGSPVVLVMGLSGTMDAWPPSFVDALAARGHRVITFDNEGIGRTTLGAGTLTVRRMADDTASLIRALRLRRADVLGWSMGGMIAQALARRHPDLVRRLVLCATAPGDGKATFPTADGLAALGSLTDNPVGLLGMLFPSGHDAAMQAYVAGILSYPGARTTAPPEVIRAQVAASATWLAGQDKGGGSLRRIKAPALVAGGVEDQLLPFANEQHMASRLPHAQLATYAGAAHGFLFQEQQRFIPRVARFLKQRAPARRGS